MRILKQLYNGEIEIKALSIWGVLVVIFASIFIPAIIHVIVTLGMVLSNPYISFGEIFIFGSIVASISTILLTILFAKLFKKKNEEEQDEPITIKKSKENKKDYLYVFILTVGYMFIREALLMDIMIQFEGPISEEDIDILINSVSDIELIIVAILFFLKVIVEAPIMEEFLYRSIALGGLLNRYKNNPKKAIIYTSALFAIAHMNIPQIINAFIMGIIFGWLYYTTKSIKLCIFAHFVNNVSSGIAINLSSISKMVCLVVGVVLFVKAIKYIKLRNQEKILV